jgi:hypothetical protein
MADVVSTAGKESAKPDAARARREVVQAVRAVLRKADASDDDVDDALEALLELAQDKPESE